MSKIDRKEYQRYFLEKELFEQSDQHQDLDFEDYYPEQPLEPYWDSRWYGGDNERYFSQFEQAGWIGCQGMDYKYDHVKQDRVWTREEVNYNLDKHGLRSNHRPSAMSNSTRILHMGQCNTFGMGLAYKDSHPALTAEYTGGSHINLSPYHSLMTMWEPLKHWVEEYKPTHIIITNPRFFTESDYIYLHLYEQNGHRNDAVEWRKALASMYLENNRNYGEMFFDYVNTLNIPTAFYFEPSRLWRHRWMRHMKPRKNMTIMRGDFSWVVDLARDCRRPGIKSQINIAEQMADWIENPKPQLGQYINQKDWTYKYPPVGKYDINTNLA